MLWTLILACSGGDPDPLPGRRTLTFASDAVPIGGELMLGDLYLGKIVAPRKYGSDREHPYIDAHTPISSEWDTLLAEQGLQLYVHTPCGTMAFPVEVDHPERGIMAADIGPARSWPRTTRVWMKGWEDEIRVGLAEPSPAGDHYTLNGLDCATSHTVTSNGRPLGTVKVDTTMMTDAFLSTKPGACYRLTRIGYGQTGADEVHELSGQLLLGLPYDRVDYLLREAPSTVSADPIETGKHKVELVEAACSG
jgi:hypothetical protein